MYEKDYRVERYDTDTTGRLKPPVLTKMLSDIMERNADSYGAGADYHLSRNLAWVLVEYQLDIRRLPRADEIIAVGTLPYSFKKMYGFRIYSVKDSNGKPLIEGKGKFLLIDIKSKKMVKPDAEILDRFTDAKVEPVALPFEKWRLSADKPLHTIERRVTHDLIDINGHLNNAHSVTLAYEVMDPEYMADQTTKSMYVRYRKEAFKDDKLSITLYDEPGGYGVAITREGTVISEVLFLKR
ncbi:MAG: acyl-[acyl-carrier-protein] thioesterase [Bacillota bacterium]